MLKNREDVWKFLNSIDDDAKDSFLPLGAQDDTTPAKAELSHLTKTIADNLPVVKSMVAACSHLPLYVGYSNALGENKGCYINNAILLENSDDLGHSFIQDYVHELTHIDQDRRGLLRYGANPPNARHMVDYLQHNMVLEAAAHANDVIALYYFSQYSDARTKNEDVDNLFGDFCAEDPENAKLLPIIKDSMKHKKPANFYEMKPAWQAVFQNFFHPDSFLLTDYLKYYLDQYMQKKTSPDPQLPCPRSWGQEREILAITTMPGWGPVFDPAVISVLRRQIMASILQEKHMGMIELFRNQALRLEKPQAAPKWNLG